MKCDSKHPVWPFCRAGKSRISRSGFTLVEIIITILLLATIVGTSLVVMNNCVAATLEIRSRQRAFDIARQNLEYLLTLSKVSDMSEFGILEEYPDIEWQLIVETFDEPVDGRMWVRAISIASFTGKEGEREEVSLEHWITKVPDKLALQIREDKKKFEDIQEALYGEDFEQKIAIVKAYLESQGMDKNAYANFMEDQRRQIAEYLITSDFDEQFELFLEELRIQEEEFLENMGVDLDELALFKQQMLESGLADPDSMSSDPENFGGQEYPEGEFPEG